jgi:outer membrane protein TolC
LSFSISEQHAGDIPPPIRSLGGFSGVWDQFQRSSLDMRIALDEIERAYADTRTTWAGVLPSMNFSTTVGYQSLYVTPTVASPTTTTTTTTTATAPGTVATTGAPTLSTTGDSISATLAITAPLVNFRAIHAIGTAKVNEQVMKLTLVDTRRQLALKLARAVVAIASAEKSALLNRSNLNDTLDRLNLTRRQLAAGVGDQRDLVRALQDLATARAAVAPGDEQVLQAREALATILGLVEGVGVGSDPDQIERDVRAFCGDIPLSGDPRSDLALNEKQTELAERNVDDILLMFAPTLTGQLQTGLVSGPFSSIGEDRLGWSVSGVISVPLFDGGQRYGLRRDRMALVDEAAATELQTKVTIAFQVAQGRRAIDVALEAMKSAKEARDLAAEADRLARVAYANGVGTNFDLIDAGKTLRQADATLLLRQLDVSSARVSLPFLEDRCAGLKSH